MLKQRNARLEELEGRFSALEPQLPESAEKEAISLLHAMLLEARRRQHPADESGNGTGASGAVTLDTVANLYKSAPAMSGRAENEGLPVGTEAPDFALPDASGRRVSLSQQRGRNVVLVFYPLDWSPACSDQLSLYQNELEEFGKYNAQVIGVSVDSIYSHGAWAAVRGITFPLLADFHPKGKIARRYKVMRDSDGFSERALYVVDANGIIRYRHVSPELPLVKLEQIDGYLQVTDEEAIKTARGLAREEGIFAGFSSGANVAAALQLLDTTCRGKTIAVLLNDSGLKYLSTDLW